MSRSGPIIAVIVGLTVTLLAGQRLVAHGLIALDAGRLAAPLRSGAPIPPDALAAARDRYATALRILPGDDEIARDLGRLDLRAHGGGKAEDADAVLAAASRHLRQAAASAPNRAFTWTLLAYSASLGAELQEGFAEYFRLSRLTGRFEASSMLLRSSIALSHWDNLPEPVRANAREDLRRLWTDRRFLNELMRFYLSRDYAGRAIMLRECFETDAERRRFQKILLRKLGIPPPRRR